MNRCAKKATRGTVDDDSALRSASSFSSSAWPILRPVYSHVRTINTLPTTHLDHIHYNAGVESASPALPHHADISGLVDRHDHGSVRARLLNQRGVYNNALANLTVALATSAYHEMPRYLVEGYREGDARNVQ